MTHNFTAAQLLDILNRAHRSLKRARRLARKRFGDDYLPGKVESARIYRDFVLGQFERQRLAESEKPE